MKKISLVAFLFSATQLLYSQESISTSGGKATGAGGSVNYIVGQIFNANVTGSNSNTLSEGVLQQHEKITYTFNTSWLPNDPSGISFAEDDVLIGTGNAIVSNTTFCNTLTVNPGAGVTINTGFSLTANTITLNSTSQLFSSLIVKGTINGTVNYNRYTALVAPTGTNDLISAPVVDQTFGSFATANTNLAASGVLRAFAPYNTISGAYENYNTTDNTATTLAAGKGFRAATTDGGTLKFTGIARTDEVDVSISDAGNAWNLIGNPYPSYIDFATFFNENKTQFNNDSAYQALYGYDGDASDGWTVWNLATITDVTITELITPGQAFFVKSKPVGGSVKFTPAMRRTGSSDDFILGKQKSKNIALCELRLTSATKSATTAIYFIEGTTRGLDVGYDAGKYVSGSAGFSIFSNLVEDNSGLDMVIQSLPYTDFNDVVIPLGINATATEITIEIDNSTKNLPDHINVYLEDTVANTLTLLNNTAYTFTPSEALIGSGRFYLRYTSKALSVLTNSFEYLQIYSANSQKEIVVKGKLNSKSSAELFDIQGRLVLRQNLEHSQISNTINVATLIAGTYIIKVFNTSQIKTQKLVIN